jgi:hypothetical protein
VRVRGHDILEAVMKGERAIQRAKTRVVERIGEADWCSAVGVGRDGERLVLVVSVLRGARAEAESLLAALALRVPIEVREVAPVKARRRPAPR